MTVLREQLFAEAFGELVARASSEPFVPLLAIGSLSVARTDAQFLALTQALEEEVRGRRFSDLESMIVAKERALRRCS